MNRNIIKKVGLAVVVVLFFAQAGYAQPARDGSRSGGDSEKWGKKGEVRTERLFKEMNLTEEQKIQLRENRKANHTKMKELRATLREKREALQGNISGTTATPESLRAIANEVKDAQNKLVDLRVEGIIKVQSILTLEQYQQFNKKMEENKGKRNKSREKKGGNNRGNRSGKE